MLSEDLNHACVHLDLTNAAEKKNRRTSAPAHFISPALLTLLLSNRSSASAQSFLDTLERRCLLMIKS